MNELKELALLAEQAQRLDEEPWYQLADLQEGFNVQPDDFAFVAAASPGTVSRLIAQIEALQYLLKQAEDEMGEQARLLGMSGSREAALLAKIDNLQNSIHSCGPTCNKAGCVNRRLMEERDGLAKDAERYRWLRHNYDDSLVMVGGDKGCAELYMEEQLDEAIDAAMVQGDQE